MSEDKRPGWLLRRMFGKKEEAWPPEPVPVQPPDPKPGSDLQSVTPPLDSPASVSEGQPDFATGAADVAHVPMPPSEPSPVEPDGNAVPDELEGADMQPVEGQEERPPAGTAGDPPERGGEQADTTSQAFAPLQAPEPAILEPVAAESDKRGWWSRLTGGMRRTSSALSEQRHGPLHQAQARCGRPWRNWRTP